MAKKKSDKKDENTHFPPREWSPELKAYAIVARRYQIAKESEWGNMEFETTSINDLFFELGVITANLSKIVEGKVTEEVNNWIINSANDWIMKAAKDANVKLKKCKGGCGRVTAANKDGKFLCVCRHYVS